MSVGQPDRRSDTKTRDRIDKLAGNVDMLAVDVRVKLERLTKRIGRWVFAQWIYLVIVTAALAILYDSINDSRRDNIRNNCIAQNERHDNTIAALDARLDAIQSDPNVSAERKAQAKQSREFTVSLINALAPPVEDCDALATNQVESR